MTMYLMHSEWLGVILMAKLFFGKCLTGYPFFYMVTYDPVYIHRHP